MFCETGGLARRREFLIYSTVDYNLDSSLFLFYNQNSRKENVCFQEQNYEVG